MFPHLVVDLVLATVVGVLDYWAAFLLVKGFLLLRRAKIAPSQLSYLFLSVILLCILGAIAAGSFYLSYDTVGSSKEFKSLSQFDQFAVLSAFLFATCVPTYWGLKSNLEQLKA